MRPRLLPLTARHGRWLIPTAIAIATVLAFLPALGNGFVSWDDQKNFLDNPHYRGLGWEQLTWMWSTFHLGHYVPLSWMTLGADYLLWGMNPTGYHATNILLHAANAVVFYFLARRLFVLAAGDSTQSERVALPAALAALLFAVHPLRVESVAWVTERRDALSLLFFQLSILAYLRACSHSRIWNRWYACAILSFACALLSKATAMTLPAVLLLVNVYPLQRIDLRKLRESHVHRVLIELAPFAALSAGFIVLSIVALRPPEQLSFGAKMAVSAYSLMFYLEKTAAPLGLSPLYEMPQQVDPFAPRFVFAYVVCVAFAAVVWMVRRKRPAIAAALAAFVIITAPMLGIVQNGPQIAADRYTYHSAPALALLASGFLFALPFSDSSKRIVGSAVVVVLGLMTWNQSRVWHDSESLWTRALELDPNSGIAHSAMASLRYRQNRLDEGLEHSRRAVELAPGYAEAHNDLAVGLAQQGQVAEAIDEYKQAIALEPTYDEAHNNLGVVLSRQGDLATAISEFQRALDLNPDYADAHVNWGNALVRSGRPADATGHYQQALAIRQDNADARLNWGVALAQQSRFAEAAEQFRAALAIDPEQQEARTYLAMAERRIANP